MLDLLCPQRQSGHNLWASGSPTLLVVFPFDKTTLWRPVATSLPLPLVVVLRVVTSSPLRWGAVQRPSMSIGVPDSTQL
jgi:hypothetical protein